MHIVIQIMLYFSSALFVGVLVVVGFRLFGSDGVRRASLLPDYQPVEETNAGRNKVPLEIRYRELLELGMIQLTPEEEIVVGCGRKGDMEEVLLLSTKRVFLMTRRPGATFFAKHTFDLARLRPVPSSAGLAGNKVVLSDGAQTAAISSPGENGFLADARLVVRELNNLVRLAQQRTPPPGMA